MYNYSKLLGAMREKGITQDKLAKNIGLSANSLTSKLKGRSQFKVSEAQKIMKILSLPENDVALYFFVH